MRWPWSNKGGGAPREHKNIRKIVIKQYGITKTVVVRTKRNGGIVVKSINVKFQ